MLNRHDGFWALGLFALAGVLGTISWVLHPELNTALAELQQGSCAPPELAMEQVPRIEVAEAQQLLGRRDVIFVDARAPEAHAAGHIPGALSLPASDAAGLLEIQSMPIAPEAQVITYCDGLSCEPSEYLGLLLRDRVGCQKVRVLAGGFVAWQAAGAEVERGSP